MITKIQLTNTLEHLPSEFSIDTLIEELMLIEKVNKGERDSINNNIVSEADVEKKIEEWFQ
jgi:hypothetical protein